MHHQQPRLLFRFRFRWQLLPLAGLLVMASSVLAQSVGRYGGFPGPKTPAESLASITVPNQCRVELVACEPLVIDPIAFDWSADGRLFVVEMRGYPNGIDGQGKGNGHVRVLFDDDHDGTFDRAETFLDNLPFPTGIKYWRNGVIITAAPEILFAQDTDGDHRADSVKTLFRGFAPANQQHRVNGLRFGLDGWLYLANGESGGVIESTKTGKQVDTAGRDLRIDPDRGLIEAVEGQTQYGRNRDDFGNWFGGSNSEPMWHYVLEERYIRRNPHLGVRSFHRNVPRRSGPAPVFPRSETVARFNDFDRANRFTSACSPIVYRDSLVGASLAQSGFDQTFVCEPVHNLVHREKLNEQAGSFVSSRLESEQQSEFLASADNWFRPVMIRTGPDGGLWIADMYRLVIEHPEWIPQSWQEKLDVRAGDDRGRIYRVTSSDGPPRPVPRFDQMSSAELVQHLRHPNGTQRDLAHQQLLWKNDSGAIEPLKELLDQPDQLSPATILHALYLLDGWGHLDARRIADVIRSAEPKVALHALRLAEAKLDEFPEIGSAIVDRGFGDHPSYDRQLVASLGFWTDQTASQLLAQIALQYASHPSHRDYAISSVATHNLHDVIGHTVEQLLQTENRTDQQLSIAADFIMQAAAREDTALHQFALMELLRLEPIAPTWTNQVVARFTKRLKSNHASTALKHPEVTQLLDDRVRNARQLLASDHHASIDQQLAAIAMLGIRDHDVEVDRQLLMKLLDPTLPLEVQLATIDSLRDLADSATIVHLLGETEQFSPRVQTRIIELLFSRNAWIKAALQAHLDQQISLNGLGTRQRQQLLHNADSTIAEMAIIAFQSDASTSRDNLVSQYLDINPQLGDPAAGRAVFTRTCASCHQLGELGHSVGPDLAGMTVKTVGAYIMAILHPNKAVEVPYLDYNVLTQEGLQYSGILVAESSTSITLLAPESKRVTILRNDMEMMTSTGRSLMPEGLEKDLTRQNLIDLICFLQSSSEPAKSFAGNQPQPAPVRDDGSIRLFAVHAQVFGPTLEFSQTHSSLSNWSSIGDRGVWTVTPKAPATFEVFLDYACAEESAGNTISLQTGDQVISVSIPSTQSSNTFGGLKVGELTLSGDAQQIVIRSAGPIQGQLLDLRTVHLYPKE